MVYKLYSGGPKTTKKLGPYARSIFPMEYSLALGMQHKVPKNPLSLVH